MNHFDLLDDRCHAVAATCIETLAKHKIDAVLGGGWAVYAHVPSVPSIDTDLFLPAPLPSVVVAALERAGLSVGAGRQVEVISTSERFGYWAFGEEDLGVPEPGFVVAQVLGGHTEQRRIVLLGRGHDVLVPDVVALALLKTCALHNRDLCYRSFDDGVAAMHVGPGRINQVRALDRSYYLRKAGKDLFDLSLLLAESRARDALWHRVEDLPTVQGVPPLRQILPQIAKPLSPTVRNAAADMARRVDRPEPWPLVDAALQAPPDRTV